MLEHVTQAMSRIEEIKSHFKSQAVGGTIGIAPHYSASQAARASQVQPFFPSDLVNPIKQKVLGSVETVSEYDGLIEDAAKKYGVDSSLIKAVIRAESGFRSNAISAAGAQGLMQLMPKTAAGLGVSDAFDPAQNIDAGAKYLKGQLDRFGGDVSKALAAYNAGPGNVIKYGGVPPFRETQNYVNRVLDYRDEFTEQ